MTSTALVAGERVDTEPGEVLPGTPEEQNTAVLSRDARDAAVATFTGSPSADEFAALVRMAEMLVPTGMLPDHIKTPGQALAIILTGRELGMPPMRAIRSLQMVKGKVVENADSQLARFKTAGGRAVFRMLNEELAVLWLRHPNGDEHTEEFTMEDATAAGLTKASSKGEPSMYVKHPKSMLRSRAITNGLKSIGWEGGAGAYDPDEARSFSEGADLPTAPVETSAPGQQSAAAARSEPEARCPVCKGAMWDNREGKKNPKAPDFKCRDRGCDGVYWPGEWPPEPKAPARASAQASAAPEDVVLPLPGSPDEGKRLGAIDSKALAGYADYCAKKITERRAAKKPTGDYERLHDAILRVQVARGAQNAETPRPASEEPARPEFQTVTQRIRALLTEPACQDIAERIEQQLAGGMTPHQLAQTKMMLEERIQQYRPPVEAPTADEQEDTNDLPF